MKDGEVRAKGSVVCFGSFGKRVLSGCLCVAWVSFGGVDRPMFGFSGEKRRRRKRGKRGNQL